ncbi:MAG TPA: hypothetical protein VF950_17645 [Planctomycetota bacterium]
MKCEKASEITAYLKGESAPEEREPLRLHFEGCATCSAELGKFDKVLKALGRMEQVEPSAGFRWRVREAFVRAHPDFLEPPAVEPQTLWGSFRQAFGYVPAWAVSVAAHAILLAVAAILFFTPPSEDEVERDLAVRATPKEKPASAPYFPEKSDIKLPVAPLANPESTKKEVGHWRERIPRDRRLQGFFEGRGRDPHQAENREAFGGQGTEKAIRAGLEWLASAQQPDGRWTSPVFSAEGGEWSYHVGVSGLALLAFLGEGHAGKGGAHAMVARRGLDFLLAEQRASGLIGPERGNYMYNHGIAALALQEAALATKDEQLQAAAAAAVAFILKAQTDEGGWGYALKSVDNDTSVSGWQIATLRLAKLGGNQGVIPALVAANGRIKMSTDSDGRVGYRGKLQFPNGYLALTAVGMFAHQMSSHTPDPALLSRQAEILLERSPIAGTDGGAYPQNDLYFAFFGSMAMHQNGGEAWTRWWGPLKERLLQAQGPDGAWPAAFDRWTVYGGAVYTTALSVLILETPVRYPRLAE